MGIGGCLGIMILSVVLFIIAVGVAIYFMVKKIGSKLQESIANSINLTCTAYSKTSYPQGTIPPILATNVVYQPDVALQLLYVCFNATISNCSNLGMKAPKGFNTINKIYGTDQKGRRQLFGYIMNSQTSPNIGYTIISFTGTFGISEWLYDVDIDQVAPTDIDNSTGLVHHGFYKVYTSLQQNLKELWTSGFKSKTTQLIITGHSLGGAIATLASLDYLSENPVVYTFASPRVGNTDFAKGYDSLFEGGTPSMGNVWRVFNTADIVPYLPLPELDGVYYTHVSIPQAFTVNLESVTKNHHTAYIEGLSNEI